VAVVRQDKHRRSIYVEVKGRQARDYFATIRKTILEINGSFEKLPFTEWVPLPDKGEYAVKYMDLIGHEAGGRKEKFVGELGKAYSVAELLGRIESQEETRGRIHALGKDESGRPIIVAQEYYAKGGKMEIKKQIIKGEHARVFNADEMKYIEHAGLRKEELQEIMEAVLKLMDKERELLTEYYERLEQLQSDSDKQKITRKIRTFLVNSGIAIAQSLTAAGIYDLGKMLFGKH
jgi:hypothetical protein